MGKHILSENYKRFFGELPSSDTIKEQFKWKTTGDQDDRRFLEKLVQRTKEAYDTIKPRKYDIDSFESDLDELLQRHITNVDKYWHAWDNKNYGVTNKIHDKWMEDAMDVFKYVTTYTGWRGQLNTFTRNLSLIWQVHMEAEAGRTGNRGYKAHKQ